MKAVILAGGENRRLPWVKAFTLVAGRRIIDAQAALFGKLFDEVLISTNEPELFFGIGLRMFGDIRISADARGPMLGIYSALIATGGESVFVCASDMPFVRPELVRLLTGYENGDAVVPLWAGRPEPLIGIYRRPLIPSMERLIGAGRTGLSEMLRGADTVFAPEEEVRKADPDGRSFVNINTPDDVRMHGAKPPGEFIPGKG